MVNVPSSPGVDSRSDSGVASDDHDSGPDELAYIRANSKYNNLDLDIGVLLLLRAAYGVHYIIANCIMVGLC